MNQTKSFIKNSNIDKTFSFYYNYNNISNNILYKKYSSFEYSYTSLCIKNLIFNEKCRIVAKFKDFLLYDDYTEFLRISFEKENLKNTFSKVIDFYDKYNKVFPNYMILPESIFMYKNLRKKQKLIDENNKIKMEKEKKDKNKKSKSKNKKDNICIFDEKIKEIINRQNNSMLTMSLTNTIISNFMNYNDNKKNECNIEDNNSFSESIINNSSINISLYSKRTLFNQNDNNNRILYNDSIKSENSLKNIVDVLNNKKFKKIKIINKIKNKKGNKLLNIDIVSNNNNINYNNCITSNLKNSNYIIKTPTKNKLFKKEKEKQIYQDQVHYKSLNNNRTIFNHKKNITAFHNFCPMIKNIIDDTLSKKKTLKYISKFPKEKKNIIEEITTSIIGKYRGKQRNKPKFIEGKNLFNNKKIESLTISQDKYERFALKFPNISKEKKIIKVNNYFTYKSINKNPKNNNLMKYNKIIRKKKAKINEEEKNNDNMGNNNKIYEMFKEKYKNNFNNEIKEKRKEINKPSIDNNSTESTKISLNHRKIKLNFYLTYEKLNNSNNQTSINNNQNNFNNEILQTKAKKEYINCNTSNNFNSNNYKNLVNDTENYLINDCTLMKNLSKNKRYQKKVYPEKKQMIHKKHKTYSSHLINNNNNFYFQNYQEENKINYLSVKLKKIKEELLKNKINYKEIKKKYRKFSENNHKKIFIYPQNPNSNSDKLKNFEKVITCSVFHNNSVEKKIRNKNININRRNTNNLVNKHLNNELLNRIKIKSNKIDKNIVSSIHHRNYTLMNNNIRSPLRKKIKREITKDNKSKDKIILNNINNKRIKFSKRN